jgi:SRSO17 transposase
MPYQSHLTTRADETSWPRWRRTWRSAKAYAAGLLLPGLGKSMQRVARSVDLPEGEIKRFVSDSPWEYERVQEHLVENVPGNLSSKKGAFIVDDVGIIKQGKHSVGVYRQYSGALGKVGNCQVAVNLVYSVPGGRLNADQKTWPLGTRLYVPKAWATADEFEELREEVHLPESFAFRTKPEIAMEMIDAARRASVPHSVTLADAGYGDDGEFRRQLRERGEPYILGVTPSSLRVIPEAAVVSTPKPTRKGGRPRTAPIHDPNIKRQSSTQIAREVKDWTRVEWSQGTKGVLSGLFHAQRVRVVTGEASRRAVTDEIGWLVLEKRSNELKAYICWGLDDANLEKLVEYAHLRWTIEQFHRESKQILGFDRFEGRSWRGWHHHITMVLLAYAFLATQRAKIGTHQLPTIPATAKALVIEKETQAYEFEGISRAKARRLAEGAVRRLTDW